MDNFFAVCETGCANEPIVVNLTLLDQDRQEAVMLRKCDQTTAVNRTWNVEDGRDFHILFSYGVLLLFISMTFQEFWTLLFSPHPQARKEQN